MNKFQVNIKDVSLHMLKVYISLAKAQPKTADCKKTIERLQEEIDRRTNELSDI